MSDGRDDRENPAKGNTPSNAGNGPDEPDADDPPASTGASDSDGEAVGADPAERGQRVERDRTNVSAGPEAASTDGESTDAPAEPGSMAASGVPIDRPTTVTAPEEYTTDRRSLAPRVQLLWGVRRVIGALLIGAILALALGGFDRDPRWAGGVTVLLILLGTVWVVLHYRIWVYQIRDDAIYLERGVVTHVRTLVPYVRIQHVDTSRGPLERALGLSTLVVYTAGSRGADVSIPGLTPAEARDLQQRVKELAIEAEGDDAL